MYVSMCNEDCFILFLTVQHYMYVLPIITAINTKGRMNITYYKFTCLVPGSQ